MKELKAKDFEDWVKRLNPFGIRDDNGEPMVFEDYGKCYLYVLNKLKEMFPKGFIDIPLFLHTITRIPLPDAVRFAKRFTFLKLNRDIYLCSWNPDDNPKYNATQIIRSLHTLSETKFSPDFFNWAWDKFTEPHTA